PVGARPSSTTTPQVPQLTLQEALRRHPPVPVTGALAIALRTNAATLEQLVSTALHHDDTGVRQEALRTTLNVVESDATLSGSLPRGRRGRGARPARRAGPSDGPSSFLRQPEPKKLKARRKSFTFPGVIGHQLISDFRPKRSMTTLCCAQNLRMPPGPWR